MKKLLPLLFFLISHLLSAQTSTETFETESISSTSFTDNGVIFDIKSHASVFDIQGDFVGTGWSGTAKDNRYIDNSNSVNDISPSFSIKTTSNLFKVNRFWVYLANQYSNQNTTGSLTITGKLSGVTKFTQTKTTGFATSLGSTNGYTLIDMTNLNGQNYSNIVIDELQITANGNYKYVGLDAFTWVKDSNIVLPESKPFITIWEVPDNGKIEIYTTNSYNYNYNISWEKIGDSSKKGIESLKKGNTTISNLSAGKYKVSITGVFPYFRAGKEFEDNNAKQLLSVNQWGTQRWKSMKESFQSATNLTSVDNDSPDLTDVTDMSRMFDHASSFNSDLNNWDVSKVTDMSYMFSGANSFNGNVSNWNVSNVTTMQGMFQVASVFNRDLSNWNVANVTDMIQVFSLANQFTSDLSNWNVANVTDMSNMFSFASSFTSDLSKWNVSKVTNMSAMFHAASSFTSDLSKWDISKVAYMPQILEYSKMSVDNYDATLKGWANLAAVPKGITFGVLGLKYCNASTERDKLIKEKGWEIKGDIKLGSDYILNNKTVVYNKQPHDIKLNTTPIAPLAVKYEIYDSSNKEIPEAINIGEYTVKAIISGCGADEIKKATLSITSVLKVTTSKTDVSCNGGSDGTASVSVLGGTTPYRYVWSTGATTQSITGLAEGTYTVTAIDANNYASTETFTVIQPTALTAITSKTDVSCNGGSNGTATVIPSGGAGGYTYSWAPSGGTAATATGLAPGIYTVTVTDANACVITRTFTITQPTALTATMSQTNVSCNGRSDGTASVTTLGGTGTYTYSWYPSGGTAATATGLAPGIYTVTVTDANSCTTTATATAIITEPNVVQTPKVTSSSVNYKYGDSATALVATNDSNHTLKWYEGDNKTLLTKVPLPITNKIGKQTYWVSQVNSTGCESELVKIEVTITPTNLTVTADAQSKVYGSVDPTLTYQVTGLVNAEKVSDVLVGSLIRVPGENVGSYAITQGDLKASSNYTLDFKTNNLEITEATLTVTADTQFKVYGSVDPTLTYQVTGLVNAEKVSDVLVGSLIRVPGENVGSYAITQGDLKASSNYTLDFKTNNLEITPATLTVTADAQSKVYGSVDPVLTYQVTGLVNAEKESD
ncbi:BspA family leucine-rich repeat surface protein, partial [Myroides marinus]|uniref:BspA family leucine-rich repeat surface protein n=2 Tax=Myroides marinus TaxID=703342 RepID=UPI0025787F94